MVSELAENILLCNCRICLLISSTGLHVFKLFSLAIKTSNLLFSQNVLKENFFLRNPIRS